MPLWTYSGKAHGHLILLGNIIGYRALPSLLGAPPEGCSAGVVIAAEFVLKGGDVVRFSSIEER